MSSKQVKRVPVKQVKQASKQASSYAPKATFKVELVKGKRVFTAVNKRAHTVAKKLGKRSKLTVAELKSSVGKGSYKFYFYETVDGNPYGALKPIKF